MANVILKKRWAIPEGEATPESVFMNRRGFLKAAGLGAAGWLYGCGHERTFASYETPDVLDQGGPGVVATQPGADLYPIDRNTAFELDRDLTDPNVASQFNNFYEFTTQKNVFQHVDQFAENPWQVEVTGLVDNPSIFDVDDLIRTMPLEERLYRHRCVEAWAMAVPWTGFQLSALLDRVQPASSARYVKMTTFLNPRISPPQFNNPQWPWPYVEALTLEEAANELTLLATGIYGRPLPKQHGAPLRLVVPWKYGFKSIKSIVRIELTAERPQTFWNTLIPEEYGFEANVNPQVPHPRWSQASELMIGTSDRRETLLYNGYGEFVAHLYA